MNCNIIIEQYLNWIKDNTVIKSIKEGGICSVSTPFLDRHNDHLQIYVVKEENKIILTDDGYTLADLHMSGLDVNTPKREKILKTILNGFGVQLGKNNELVIEANMGNLGQKKHYFLQAILAVNDMYTLSTENVYSLFKEDVESFFQRKEIFYTKDIKLTGKSGFDHNIDFIIPRSKNKPERVVQTMNNPQKEHIKATIFTFGDIQETRQQDTSNFVIYNDIENNVPEESLNALRSYDIKTLSWSKKEEMVKAFAMV